MTKTQIMARSILAGLVVYAGFWLLAMAVTLVPYPPSDPGRAVAGAVLGLGLVMVAGYYVVRLARGLLPEAVPGDQLLAPGPAACLLAQSLRLTMVALGLFLLPGSIPTIVGILRIPFILREFITEIIVDHELPRRLYLATALWIRHAFDLTRMLLTLYLLCGAPQFVRWQAARIGRHVGQTREIDERSVHG